MFYPFILSPFVTGGGWRRWLDKKAITKTALQPKICNLPLFKLKCNFFNLFFSAILKHLCNVGFLGVFF